MGVLVAGIQLFHNPAGILLLSSLLNLLFVSILLAVCLAYSKLILKQRFFEVMGFGDVLFFIFLCFTFSIISFIVLFVFSLLFALILNKVFHQKHLATVPLAGNMSLFFSIVYLAGLFFNCNFLFAY
jgi:hypothetical protein